MIIAVAVVAIVTIIIVAKEMIVSTEACINSNNHKKLPQGPAALRESLSSCPYVAIRMYRSTLMRNLSHTRSQCAPPVER